MKCCRSCMVVLPLLLLCAAIIIVGDHCGEASEGKPKPLLTIRDRYLSIMRNHEQTTAEAWRTKQPSASRQEVNRTLREIIVERDNKLEELVLSAVKKDNLSEVAVGDLAALAMACEYLRRREDCIKFGKLAVARDPTYKEVYFPYMRSLLNLKRTAEAEKLLLTGTTQVGNGTELEELHFLLYHRHRADSHPLEAYEHFRSYLNAQVAWLPTKPAAASVVLRHLKQFRVACRAANKESEGTEFCESTIKRVESAIDTWTEFRGKTSRQDEIRFTALSRLLHLNSELHRSIDPPQFSDCMILWCEFITNTLNMEQTPRKLQELMRLLVYTEASSDSLDPAAIQRIVQTASAAVCEVATGNETAALGSLLDGLRQEAETEKKRIGTSDDG